MLVLSDVTGDARVRREAEALARSGRTVRVIGRGPAVPPPAGWPPGVHVDWVGASSPFPSRSGTAAGPLRRAARWTLLPAHRRATLRSFCSAARVAALREGFDVVHAHDFPMLRLGAELAAARDGRLVYDAHEYWVGRRREERPTPLEDRRCLRDEGRLGAEADAVLTVSAALATRLRARFHWHHVTVVHNSFPAALQAAPPPAAPRRLVYAGRVGAGRDLHTVTRAAPQLAPLTVTLVGPVDPTFGATLATHDVDLRPPVDVDEVDTILGEGGLALIPLEDGCENHRLALPNKLFQAVRAGVPVVAADLPALRRVVDAQGLGTLYRPGSRDSLVGAVQEATARYPELVGNVQRAAAGLAWEHDEERLLGVYETLETAPGRAGAR